MNRTARRASFLFLSALPFVGIAVAAIRPLRVPGVHSVVGLVLFLAIAGAVWALGARAIAAPGKGGSRLAVAGTLLVLPWAVISLLWVGLGAPFQATPAENQMRFLVLLGSAIVVAGGFLVLREELDDAGERFYSTLGFAASIPAGIGYLGCMSVISASYLARMRDVEAPPITLLSDLFDVLEFVGCVMTYLATAAFAASLGKAGWLGRGAVRGYVVASAILLGLILARGIAYPDFSQPDTPWYLRATWIAGIPAIPWIMPCLLGVVALRRAGED